MLLKTPSRFNQSFLWARLVFSLLTLLMAHAEYAFEPVTIRMNMPCSGLFVLTPTPHANLCSRPGSVAIFLLTIGLRRFDLCLVCEREELFALDGTWSWKAQTVISCHLECSKKSHVLFSPPVQPHRRERRLILFIPSCRRKYMIPACFGLSFLRSMLGVPPCH